MLPSPISRAAVTATATALCGVWLAGGCAQVLGIEEIEPRGSGGSGPAAECTGSVPGECDDGDPCTDDGCEQPAGRCVNTPRTGIAPADVQVLGDCQVIECTAGVAATVAAAEDLPVDENDCTEDRCEGSTPSNPPLPSGAECSSNGGRHCDGEGACVVCPLQMGFGDPPCDACFALHCCEEALACENDVDWNDYFDCRVNCSNETCFQQCEDGHSTGAALHVEMMSCLSQSCTTDCSLANAICDSSTWAIFGDPQCADCLGEGPDGLPGTSTTDDDCCFELKECELDMDCMDCVTEADVTKCGNTSLDEAVTACTGTMCSATCIGM